MSRQSKNRKNLERAKEFTRLHKQGQKGPKSSIPVHGKRLENRAYSRIRRSAKAKVDSRTKTNSASVAV
jgi:hypothetical protein